VADPEQPLEIIRTIHSFDPCIACAVPVVDTERERTRWSIRLIPVVVSKESVMAY